MNDNDQTQQPMILVKKSDGTTVRVPLASLQRAPLRFATDGQAKNKEQRSSQTIGVVDSTIQPHDNSTASQHNQITSQPPMDVKEHIDQKMLPPEPAPVLLEESYEDDVIKPKAPPVSTNTQSAINKPTKTALTPVQRWEQSEVIKFTNNATAQKHWSASDHASPLTETINNHDGVHEVSAIRGDGQIISFLDTSPVFIAKELHGRTVALLSSFVKGVRTREQAVMYATKPKETGGLNLADVDAEMLIKSAEQHFHLRPTIIPRKNIISPQKMPNVVNSQKQPEVAKEISRIPILEDNVYTINPSVSDIIIPKSPAKEVVVSDDEATINTVDADGKSQPVGPIEEMETFTADDFRRLEDDPNKATDTILMQIENITHESPLLGLEIRRAWFKSPLYEEYLNMLSQSLGGGFSLTELSQTVGGGLLTQSEIVEIMRVNRACEEV